MKEGWQTKALGDVCEIYQPKTISTKEMIPDGAYPVFGANGVIGRYDKYNHEEPQLLLTCRGATCGAVNVSTPKSWITGNAMVIRPKAADINMRFLEYLFRGGVATAGVITGSAQPQITRTNLTPLKISYPPLPEQQRIVAKLDEAFEGIAIAKANAEQNLKNARAIFESELNTIFTRKGEGWRGTAKPLSELCTFIVDCEHKTAPTQDEGIPSIRTTNVGRGTLLLDGVKRVSEETYKEWTRRAAPAPGDLILAREAPAGNVAVIPEGPRLCLGQRTVLIRPRRDIFDPHFLAFLLLGSRMQEKLLAHSRGATVQHVNMKDIRALDIGEIPSVEEQRDIVLRMQDISTEAVCLESIYERKLSGLDALKKSLLHHAFTGQL
jgi:type I restriction enzyme S subunit